MGKKKSSYLTPEILKLLLELPDKLYDENLDNQSKAELNILLHALDDASDFINDYLTTTNYSVQHVYPDISDSRH